jgi:predicted enzyme related to lactoylglutathione lyase
MPRRHAFDRALQFRRTLERADMATTPAENDRRIDYVEFNVADVARARKFYGEAFGWSFRDFGPDYCEFADGRLTGGFARGEAGGSGGPLVILYAIDLADAQARVEAAGGRIVKPAYDFPGGRRFHFADPDGYQLAVWSAR